MIGIDTNILVRYLTQDDKVQSKLAGKIIDQYVSKSQSIFINNIVMCELVWVLNRGYKYKKEQIASVLRQIFSTTEFAFEHQSILWEALDEYENKDLDFSDALIAGVNDNHECKKTFTFDQSASQNSNFELLQIDNE